QWYLWDEYANNIVSHIEGAATGDSAYDGGAVWVSGYNTIPSGYMDFHGKTFQYKFNNTELLSGMIPNGNYGIFLIVEDVNGHKTGIDLIQASTSSTLCYRVIPRS